MASSRKLRKAETRLADRVAGFSRIETDREKGGHKTKPFVAEAYKRPGSFKR